MGTFLSLIQTFSTRRRTKRTIRNIEKNNEVRRNITRYEPSDIEAFIERDPQVGSYIVSGGSATVRARAGASVAACALYQNIPVIILHEGNSALQSNTLTATSFSNNKTIISRNSSVYDPFYNRTNQEICNLILNSSRANSAIGAAGQQYITGVAEFIRSKNIPPYGDMFLTCPHDTLFDKIDDSVTRGYLSETKADQIKSLLMQGQAERANIQAFFSQLAYQGSGILSTQANRRAVVNIKQTVLNRGLMMVDIGSSTNDLLLNLLINEVKEVLAAGEQIMLILDGININSNENLSMVIKSLPARCMTALLSDDVYAMLGADDSLFHTFVGNACKCVVSTHSMGVSSNKWSEVFGYYDVNKVSQNLGGNQNYQWGYGFAANSSINVSTNREFIVKPEEISRLSPSEVYILDRNARELAYTTIR